MAGGTRHRPTLLESQTLGYLLAGTPSLGVLVLLSTGPPASASSTGPGYLDASPPPQNRSCAIVAPSAMTNSVETASWTTSGCGHHLCSTLLDLPPA